MLGHHHDTAMLLARATLGGFFMLARFRFFFDPIKPKGQRCLCPARYNSLRNKMIYCGWTKLPGAWAWLAAVVEVFGGLGIVIGLWTLPSTVLMLGVLLAATACTAREKVAKQNPVDRIDVAACYLWLAEPLYIVLAVMILLCGPGAYSVDALL